MAALPCSSFANIGIQSVAFRSHNAMALVPNPRDLDDLLGTIAKTRPTAFGGGAPCSTPCSTAKVRAGKVDFSSIKVCFSGVAPLLAETAPLRGADRRANRRGATRSPRPCWPAP